MKTSFNTLLMAILLLLAANYSQAQVVRKHAAMLTGKHQPDKLATDEEQAWFGNGVKTYASDTETIAAIKQRWSPDLQIVAFAGSWCPDTHRELPGFFRVLQDAGVPDESVSLYFLNRKMDSGTSEEKQYGVKSVPTFIVLQHGKEIGRIKHKPGKPAEVLLLKIISK